MHTIRKLSHIESRLTIAFMALYSPAVAKSTAHGAGAQPPLDLQPDPEWRLLHATPSSTPDSIGIGRQRNIRFREIPVRFRVLCGHYGASTSCLGLPAHPPASRVGTALVCISRLSSREVPDKAAERAQVTADHQNVEPGQRRPPLRHADLLGAVYFYAPGSQGEHAQRLFCGFNCILQIHPQAGYLSNSLSSLTPSGSPGCERTLGVRSRNREATAVSGSKT